MQSEFEHDIYTYIHTYIHTFSQNVNISCQTDIPVVMNILCNQNKSAIQTFYDITNNGILLQKWDIVKMLHNESANNCSK